MFASTLPKLKFTPGVHINYAETVLPMRDGLPKLEDFPAEFGGVGGADRRRAPAPQRMTSCMRWGTPKRHGRLSPAMTFHEGLFRGFAGGDDLVGRAAGQFGHVIELGVKPPTPAVAERISTMRSPISASGIWRAPSPSRPAFARVEAENLAAPPRDDGVDLRRRIGRADDLDQLDRLEQDRRALRQRFSIAMRPAVRNAMSEESTE